jgi:hypothetical protein
MLTDRVQPALKRGASSLKDIAVNVQVGEQRQFPLPALTRDFFGGNNVDVTLKPRVTATTTKTTTTTNVYRNVNPL